MFIFSIEIFIFVIIYLLFSIEDFLYPYGIIGNVILELSKLA